MSEQIEYTITRALAELKLLDKKIQKTINTGMFVAYKQKSKKIYKQYTDEEFSKIAKSDFDSVKALIENRNKLKSKIVESNATTYINVAGTKMSVAEAIERKSNIKYDKALLDKLKDNLAASIDKIEDENERSKKATERYLEAKFGTDGKIDKKEIEDLTKTLEEKSEFVLVDPLNIKDVIENIENEIDNFENEVDFVLSESNTINKIII